jgi:ABC-type uncharacterized transport system substrate-binding protein
MRRVALFALFALSLSAAAFAHPHMSLESRIEFEYAGKTCTAIRLEWTFDPFFSASIIQETDTDRNGRLDAKESENVRNYAFVNLRKFGYFTYIRKGDQRVTPEKIEGFVASIRGDRLVYSFTVPLAGKGYGEDFNVAVFDTTYFCAVMSPPSGAAPAATITQTEAGAPKPRWERVVNKKYPVYYNPQSPATDGTVYTAWKPGLETAYPEEIHVFF